MGCAPPDGLGQVSSNAAAAASMKAVVPVLESVDGEVITGGNLRRWDGLRQRLRGCRVLATMPRRGGSTRKYFGQDVRRAVSRRWRVVDDAAADQHVGSQRAESAASRRAL